MRQQQSYPSLHMGIRWYTRHTLLSKNKSTLTMLPFHDSVLSQGRCWRSNWQQVSRWSIKWFPSNGFPDSRAVSTIQAIRRSSVMNPSHQSISYMLGRHVQLPMLGERCALRFPWLIRLYWPCCYRCRVRLRLRSQSEDAFRSTIILIIDKECKAFIRETRLSNPLP